MYRYSLWLALSLVACGGGGGGDTTPPKPTEPENGWLTFDKPDVVVLQGDSEQVTVKADRKSTRLNSSHSQISYAVFCLKKKNTPKILVSSGTSRTHTRSSPP